MFYKYNYDFHNNQSSCSCKHRYPVNKNGLCNFQPTQDMELVSDLLLSVLARSGVAPRSVVHAAISSIKTKANPLRPAPVLRGRARQPPALRAYARDQEPY